MRSEAGGIGKLCYCGSAELNHFCPWSRYLKLDQIVLCCTADCSVDTYALLPKTSAQYNQSSYLMHSVPVQKKKKCKPLELMAIWVQPCRWLLGRIWLIAQGLFFFLNYPQYTEVGEFQRDKRKISHSISLPQICEVWCLHFKICLVQISFTNWPAEAERDGQTYFLVARHLTLETRSQTPRKAKVQVKFLPSHL